MLYRSYLRFLVFFALTALLGVAGLNWLIDPYYVYGSPSINGLNTNKTEFGSQQRLGKAFAIKHQRPGAVILGSSRAWIGLRPDNPAWGTTPVYNLGLNATNIYETFRYLQHAAALHDLETVVLGADFFAWNAYRENQADFDESYFAVAFDGSPQGYPLNHVVSTLLSFDAFTSSVRTVLASAWTLRVQATDPFFNHKTGSRRSGLGEANRDKFIATEKHFLTEVGFLTPNVDTPSLIQHLRHQPLTTSVR